MYFSFYLIRCKIRCCRSEGARNKESLRQMCQSCGELRELASGGFQARRSGLGSNSRRVSERLHDGERPRRCGVEETEQQFSRDTLHRGGERRAAPDVDAHDKRRAEHEQGSRESESMRDGRGGSERDNTARSTGQFHRCQQQGALLQLRVHQGAPTLRRPERRVSPEIRRTREEQTSRHSRLACSLSLL